MKFIKVAKFFLGLIVATTMLVSVPVAVSAQTTQAQPPSISQQLDAAGRAGFGISSSTASTRFIPVLNAIIGVFLGFVGTIAFIVFLMGGFLWMTARGNTDQVDRAKKYMFNGTLGVIIIIMAYSLAFFLTEFVFKATTGNIGG